MDTFMDWGESFPAVDSSQLHIGQDHADNYDSQQSHLVLPEAPHRVVDVLFFQEQLPWDAAAQTRDIKCVCICVNSGKCYHTHGVLSL